MTFIFESTYFKELLIFSQLDKRSIEEIKEKNSYQPLPCLRIINAGVKKGKKQKERQRRVNSEFAMVIYGTIMARPMKKLEIFIIL